MPYCAKTYCVKPLQSKPAGSAPPLRYGVPRSASAVPVSAYASNPAPAGDGRAFEGAEAGANGAGAGDGASGGGACRAAGPPGSGNGLGVAPVDAHPVAPSPRASAQTSRHDGRKSPQSTSNSIGPPASRITKP